VSFNPDFPPSMQFFVKRVERDMVLMADMETEVRLFLKELEAKVAALRQRYEDGPSPLREQLERSAAA
jgi:hypothetical protein